MKFPRRLFLLSLVSCALMFRVAGAAASEPKTISQSAALYESPKGKTIGRLSPGAAVEVLQTKGDFALVTFEAWAPKSAFSKVPPLLARVKRLTIAEENIDLRSEPAGGKILGRVSKEAQLEMKDAKGKWIKTVLSAWVSPSALGNPSSGNPRVRITTSAGDIVIELDPKRAPKTVANFLSYVEKGHYDSTIFHRVIETFMIQGGGFTQDYTQKPTDPPVPIESSNGLKNIRGTVAMARTNDPNSATSQFFINVVDNAFLDYKSDAEPGYTVFGRVTDGMDAAEQIRKIPTGAGGPFQSDVPQTPVVITKASKVE